MGVRESVAQQPENEMRLHEMTVQETSKKPELLFDPETDITPEEWEMLMASAQDVIDRSPQDRSLWEDFSRLAPTIKFLSPERWREFDNDDIKGKMKKRLREADSETVGAHSYRAHLKMLFPDVDLEEYRDRMKKPYYSSFTLKIMRGEQLIKTGFNLKLINPEWLDQRPWELSGDFVRDIRQELDNLRILAREDARNMEDLLNTLARIKVLMPEKFNEFCSTDELKEIISVTLKHDRQDMPFNKDSVPFKVSFAENLFDAYILSAESINITKNNGLEIITSKPEEFKEPKTPLPERRKF